MTDSQFSTLLDAVRRLQADMSWLKRKIGDMERHYTVNATSTAEAKKKLAAIEMRFDKLEMNLDTEARPAGKASDAA